MASLDEIRYKWDNHFYIKVVSKNKRGKPFADNKTRIRLETFNGRLVQWLNVEQAIVLLNEYPNQMFMRHEDQQ
jgi:hypothetical protein